MRCSARNPARWLRYLAPAGWLVPGPAAPACHQHHAPWPAQSLGTASQRGQQTSKTSRDLSRGPKAAEAFSAAAAQRSSDDDDDDDDPKQNKDYGALTSRPKKCVSGFRTNTCGTAARGPGFSSASRHEPHRSPRRMRTPQRQVRGSTAPVGGSVPTMGLA